MILGGLALLWAFGDWEERRVRLGEDALLDVKLLSIVTMRAGLGSMFMLQLVLLGFFVLLRPFSDSNVSSTRSRTSAGPECR